MLLADIDQAGADIERFIEGMDSGAYASDALTQAAVERKFEIIGEALARIFTVNRQGRLGAILQLEKHGGTMSAKPPRTERLRSSCGPIQKDPRGPDLDRPIARLGKVPCVAGD